MKLDICKSIQSFQLYGNPYSTIIFYVKLWCMCINFYMLLLLLTHFHSRRKNKLGISFYYGLLKRMGSGDRELGL